MKVRSGFVSNSSSASFVVHWRIKTMGKETTILGALANLYGVHSYDESKDTINWEKTWTTDSKKTIEYTVNMSKLNKDGSFTTSFGTICLNVHDDFGEDAKSLVLGLVANPNFEIIDAIIEEDNYENF